MYQLPKKWFLTAKSFLLVIVAGIILPATMTAQRVVDITLTVIDTIDYCGDKTAIVVVNVGEIQKSDSLLLYDIPLEYDNTKLTFERPLWNGTLSETLDIRDYGKPDSNVARIYAFNVTRFISGNLPLVAAQFKYKGTNCSGENAQIRVGSSIDINKEAKISYGVHGSTTIRTIIKDKPDRSLKIEFSNDTIRFSKAGDIHTIQSVLTFPANANLLTASISVELDTNETELLSATAIPSGVIVDKIERQNTGYSVLIKRTDNKPLSSPLPIELKAQRRKEGIYQGTMHVSVADINTCACITRRTEDNGIIIAEPISSVDDSIDKSITLHTDGDVWELQSSGNIIEKILVVDMLGRTRYEQTLVIPSQKVRIQHDGMEHGVYILIAGSTHKIETIKATK